MRPRVPHTLLSLSLQIIKTQDHSTTNLRRHVGAIHNRADLMYNSQKKYHQRKRSFISPEMKKILDEKHLQAIVIDSRAFNDFSRPGIRSFFSTALPGYKPLHRTTVRRRLRDKYIEHRRAVRSVFTDVSDIALTADTWNSVQHRHFISVTAHFFDKKFKLISLTLGFRVIDGRHGAARLAKFINKEATFFKIREKIRSITTDNAKNIVNAAYATGLGTHLSCMAPQSEFDCQKCHRTSEKEVRRLFLLTKRMSYCVYRQRERVQRLFFVTDHHRLHPMKSKTHPLTASRRSCTPTCLGIITYRFSSRKLTPKGRATTSADADDDIEESSMSEDFSVDDYSISQGITDEDDDEGDGDGTSSHVQYSSEDEASSISSEDESSPTDTQSEPLVNPMLTRIHDLLKRVRDFVGLVAQSGPVHEYMRRMCKDNKLPGQVSNSKREEIYCLVNSDETSCTEWTWHSQVETSTSQKMCEISIIMSKEIDPQKMRFVLIRSCERRTQ